MRTAAFQQKLRLNSRALPAYEVLEMATVNGAKVLGWDDLGMLAPGFQADIITINLDQPHFYPRFSVPAHLVYAAHAGDVRTVIVAGNVLMEERKLLTLDQQRVFAEAEERAKRIAGELGK